MVARSVKSTMSAVDVVTNELAKDKDDVETELTAINESETIKDEGNEENDEDVSPDADADTEERDQVAEVDQEPADVEQAESLRRKRDREGSLEPSLTPSKQETIPAKKNRLQSDIVAEVPTTTTTTTTISSSSPPRQSTNVEGEKVGHIRKRVQDLSWKQRKEGNRDDGVDEGEDVDDDAKEETEKKNERREKEGAEEDRKGSSSEQAEPSTSSQKRSQPTFSSFSSSSGFAGGAAKKASVSIFDQKEEDKCEQSTSTPPPKSPPALPARTQPTFSSFSKSSSPFGSASASIAGPSWLAGKASGSGSTSGGGIKPSSLGSMPGDGKDEARSTPSPSFSATTSPPPQAKATGKGLGFGAFASSTPFAAKSMNRSSTPLDSGSEKGSVKEGESGKGDADNGKSFDEALREADATTADDRGGKVPRVETQLDKGTVDLRTGEEDETTVASIRAKLFTMAEDKSWKERGTGTVRCNVPKRRLLTSATGNGGRLVMRSEGVLRLILNVTLFKGMKVNLEQDKFLRLVAFEDGKLNHFALRMGNAVAASQFYHVIQQHIPTTDGDPANGVGEEDSTA